MRVMEGEQMKRYLSLSPSFNVFFLPPVIRPEFVISLSSLTIQKDTGTDRTTREDGCGRTAVVLISKGTEAREYFFFPPSPPPNC